MAKWWERLPRTNLAWVRIRPGVWFFRLRLFPFSGGFSLGLRLSSVRSQHFKFQFHIRRPRFQQWKGIIFFLINRFFDYVICKWPLYFHSAALASDDTDTEQADDLEKVKANIWNFLWFSCLYWSREKKIVLANFVHIILSTTLWIFNGSKGKAMKTRLLWSAQ